MTDLDLDRLLARADASEEEVESLGPEWGGELPTPVVAVRTTELRALLDRVTAAEEEAERLRRQVDFLAPFVEANDGLGQALVAARADLARFRAALTDPAAVEAVATGLRERGAVIEGDVMTHRECARGAAAALRAFTSFVDEEADRSEPVDAAEAKRRWRGWWMP